MTSNPNSRILNQILYVKQVRSIMQTKLTLRLDDELINRAKSYARESGKSVSELVAGYFSVLDDKPERDTSDLTPIVRSLKGSLKGAKVDKKHYHKYLGEKHL